MPAVQAVVTGWGIVLVGTWPDKRLVLMHARLDVLKFVVASLD